MEDERKRRRKVAWVANEVMPHEPLVRAWLARSMVSRDEIDDLIQDAYCSLWSLENVEHIQRPDAFFFQTVRNLLINQIKRARIVRIDRIAEIEFLGIGDEAPSPERIVGDRMEWDRLQLLIDALPERSREVFYLRKVNGMPQREIAARLGVTENVVENEGANGLRSILQALRGQGETIASEYEARRKQFGKKS